MPKESSDTKVTRARNVIAGLRRRMKPGEVIMMYGVNYTREDLVELFQRHMAAVEDKQQAYAAYRSAVAVERKLARQAQPIWTGLNIALSGRFGSRDLPAFGMKEHKKPGPKTLASKLAGVQKRAKKRAPK